MKTGKWNIAGSVVALGFLLGPGVLLATESLESSLGMPTDGHGDHLFILNPAMSPLDKTMLQLGIMSGSRKAKVTGSPDSGNAERLSYETQTQELGGGFLAPIGDGAALGINGQYIGQDLGVGSNGQADVALESASFRKYEGRFILGLTDELRFGFAYRYLTVNQSVLGALNLDDGERTVYHGTLTGYSAGLFYDGGPWGAGIGYVPAMRGKSEIVGEQKILTEPGLATLDGYVTVDPKVTLGASFQKWYVKHDDRQELSTSLADQRNISLYGLDIEQFFFKTQAIALGADVAVYHELLLRLSVFRQEGVFLSQDNAKPGDKSDSETRMSYLGARVALNFQRDGFTMEMGLRREDRHLGSFRDPRNVFGHDRFGGYKATETGGYLSLGFTP